MPSGTYKHKPCSKETKKKISLANKGGKLSEEHKKKLSIAHKGKPSPRLGAKLSEKTRKKISKNRKNKKLGKNNPNYKNGKYTIENRKKYWHYTQSYDYKQWRIAIFERDRYRCQGCQQVGGYLTAHHIKSWAHYPKLRYEINNGITLCEECHKLTDNYKGRGKR